MLLLLPFLLMGFYHLWTKKADKKTEQRSGYESISQSLSFAPGEDYKSMFKKYVMHVIVHGSNSLGFPTEMEGGYVSKEDAKKIVAYMMSMQDLKPFDEDLVHEGAALFYGNCVGCHGVGGKGQKGLFPDLTRKPLLGIEKIQKSAKSL